MSSRRRAPVTVEIEDLGPLTIRPLSNGRWKVIARHFNLGDPGPALAEILRRALGEGFTPELDQRLADDIPMMVEILGEIVHASEPAPCALVDAFGWFAVAAAQDLAEASA